MISKLITGFYLSVKKFDDKSDCNRRVVYYLIYSSIFIFVSALVFSWFLVSKRSFIWGADGLKQHYPSLIYFGKYLREIVTGFISTGSLSIPMWDFNIGYGSDILTTLHYYVIGDPLNLLSAIVPSSKTEILYNFLIVLRLYLAGFAFSAYCRKIGKGRFASLCGSFVYVFCGYALFASIRHPYFINPMIYLPLLLIGIEKIFAKQKPYVFILTVFLSAFSNFYFFYMLSVLIFIYGAIRFFAVFKEKRLKNLFKTLCNFIGFYIVGLLMACVIFLPIVQALMLSSRMNTQNLVDLLYPITYYQKITANFITSGNNGYWTLLGYSSLSLLSIVLLFTKRKKHTQLKIGFILLSSFLLIPFIGHILHGFSYVSNRWVWGYSFVVALILTTVIPDIFAITKKQLTVLSVFSVAYFTLCVMMENAKSEQFFVSYFVLILSIIFMLFLYIRRKESAGLNSRFKYKTRLSLLGLVIIGIVVQSTYKYSFTEENYTSEFLESGKAYSILEQTPSYAVKNINDNSFYRFEENKYGGQGIYQNSPMFNEQNGTSFFFSISNPYVSNYLKDIDGSLTQSDFNYSGLDNKAMPGTIAGNKYYVIKQGLERFLPYGYTRQVLKYKDFLVYENDCALPLGYTYSGIILKNEYDKLSTMEKQQAVLQGAIIEAEEAGSLLSKSVSPLFNDSNISYDITCGSGVEYKDGSFIVSKAQAAVTLDLKNALQYTETYLDFENLYYTGINPLDIYSDDEWSKLSIYEQYALRYKHRYWKQSVSADITVKSGNITKTLSIHTPEFSWYNNKHNFSMNLCYSENAKTKIELKFNQTGKYSFDSLNVICQPMDNYLSQVESLKEDILENVSIKSNFVSGNISLDKDKLLCLSIPYSEGWKAYVNGKETELLNVNVMYCGMYLEAGSYNIELKYTTPYLKHGMILSVTGLFLFILIMIYQKYKIKKKQQPTF